MGLNSYMLATSPFDPYPFILLNLVLSCLAAIQAPVIMMSQNRQEERDRLRAMHDYQVNLKAELDSGFCGVGKHSHKKAIILVTCTDGSNLSCAYVFEGTDLISSIVLGIGIFRDFRIVTSSEVGSLR